MRVNLFSLAEVPLTRLLHDGPCGREDQLTVLNEHGRMGRVPRLDSLCSHDAGWLSSKDLALLPIATVFVTLGDLVEEGPEGFKVDFPHRFLRDLRIAKSPVLLGFIEDKVLGRSSHSHALAP